MVEPVTSIVQGLLFMKRCPECKETKQLSEFTKAKDRKDGHKAICKPCDCKRSRAYLRTKMGVVNKIYNKQKSKSITRGHNAPSYTREELRHWLYSQDLFHELYEIWAESDYMSLLKPSIDRINNNKGYSMDNIRLMTWAENDARGHRDIREGVITR